MSLAAGIPPKAPPLSVAQEAMFYQCLLAPEASSYNETISIRKDGPFDVDTFRRAFNEIVRRHAAWRTTFEVVGGEPVQVVAPPSEFELPLLDLSALGEDAEQEAVRLVAEVSRVPYDLRRGPLLRPRLIRLAPDHHRLYLAIHHLVFDGVSVPTVVLPELVALYDAFGAGHPSPLPEPVATYGDYARFEQEWMAGDRAQRRLEHWREHLAGAPTLRLPTDRRRPPSPRHRGAVLPLHLDAALLSELRAVGRDLGATLFQVLAAGWAIVLSRVSGQDDVVFSTATGLRQRPEFEHVVGCSVTPLVLRLDASGDPSFSELVLRTRNELLDGLDHLVPFERIVRALSPTTAPGANPIYQTMIVLEPATVAPDPAWSVRQMEPEIGDAVGTSRLDLELGLDERADGSIEGRVAYDPDLFERDSVGRLLTRFRQVLMRAAEEPGAPLSSMVVSTEQERRALLGWNTTVTERPARTVDELVAARVAAAPDAPAVSAGDCEVTYAELGAEAAAITKRLLGAGIGEGKVVALCAEPSTELVASALGVLGAGAAYLLLDPRRPLEQLERAVSEVGAALVYAEPELAARLTGRSVPIEGAPGTASPSPGEGDAGDQPCWVQVDPVTGIDPCSSGHRAVAASALSLAAELGVGAADTVLVLDDTLYRASAVELWMPLCAGARIVLAPAGVSGDGAALRALAGKARASFLHASAERWRTLIESGLRPVRGLGALCSGPLDEELADAVLGRVRVLFAGIGGPGTTGYATLGRVEPGGPVTCGRPVPGTRIFVLDDDDQMMPPDVVGRLVVAGDAVAVPWGTAPPPRGRPVPDPGGGPGPAVELGWRARWRSGGRLEVLGPARPARLPG